MSDAGATQRNAAVVLLPEIKCYPLYRRPVCPDVRSEEVRKKLSPQGFDPRTVQAAEFRHSDQVILAHIRFLMFP